MMMVQPGLKWPWKSLPVRLPVCHIPQGIFVALVVQKTQLWLCFLMTHGAKCHPEPLSLSHPYYATVSLILVQVFGLQRDAMCTPLAYNENGCCLFSGEVSVGTLPCNHHGSSFMLSWPTLLVGNRFKVNPTCGAGFRVLWIKWVTHWDFLFTLVC